MQVSLKATTICTRILNRGGKGVKGSTDKETIYRRVLYGQKQTTPHFMRIHPIIVLCNKTRKENV
jgi:hypothetical protein